MAFAQRPKDKRHKYFTFMMVPHDAEKEIIKFRAPSFVVICSILFILLAITIFTSSVIYTANLSRRLIHYRAMLELNEEQNRQIDYFAQESNKLKRAIEELLTRDNEIRGMLGLRQKSMDSDLSGIIATKQRENFTSKDEIMAEKVKAVKDSLSNYNDSLAKRQQSLEELKNRVASIRSRFYNTPSTWPVYGSIVSFFGYRTRPWRSFHTGADITCWYGAPIRATAGGVVIYSGWLGGYGNAIKIDHGYGLETLYGHNSRLEVSVGNRVRKGQIIAYAGSTGLSTGPHCHYEVRRGGGPINPIGYLNLNIFSASRIWNGAR